MLGWCVTESESAADRRPVISIIYVFPVRVLEFLGYDDRETDNSELPTGRMDPRVESGRVGSRFCRILAGRVGSGLWIFYFFTDYSLVPESI